jgi:hypothetical protein
VLGATSGELAFVVVMAVIVVVAQIAPRIGEAIAVRLHKPPDEKPPDGR